MAGDAAMYHDEKCWDWCGKKSLTDICYMGSWQNIDNTARIVWIQIWIERNGRFIYKWGGLWYIIYVNWITTAIRWLILCMMSSISISIAGRLLNQITTSEQSPTRNVYPLVSHYETILIVHTDHRPRGLPNPRIA